MGWRASVFLGLAAVLAASAALAQRSGGKPEPVSPYLDPRSPLFDLPPPPVYTPSPIFPPPARPDPVPEAYPPARAPSAGGLIPPGAGELSRQGFTMTVIKQPSMQPRGAIDRPRTVAERLAACWEPPSRGVEVTVRVAFHRNGTLIGEPRVTYVNSGAGADRVIVTRSMEKALARCLPLRFTADLGSAIAGRPFAIRFIAPGAARP